MAGVAGHDGLTAMSRKLHLTLPKGFESARAQVSILAQDLTVERSTTLSQAAAGIELEPGIYAARAVLADGRVLQAAFQLTKGGKKAVVELAAMPPLVPAASMTRADEESDGGGQAGTVPESAVLGSTGRFGFRRQLEIVADLSPVPEPPSLSLVSLGLDGNVAGAALRTTDVVPGAVLPR